MNPFRFQRIIYYYCHNCARWFTGFVNRAAVPLVCAVCRKTSRRHILSAEKLASFLETLETAPPSSPRKYLMGVFARIPRTEITGFLSSNAAYGSTLEMVTECYRRTKDAHKVKPRVHTPNDALTYELAAAAASSEVVRAKFETSGFLRCTKCHRNRNHVLFAYCRNGHCICYSCADDSKVCHECDGFIDATAIVPFEKRFNL